MANVASANGFANVASASGFLNAASASGFLNAASASGSLFFADVPCVVVAFGGCVAVVVGARVVVVVYAAGRSLPTCARSCCLLSGGCLLSLVLSCFC